MKLAILTQYYPPEVGAQPVRLSHLAERAAARGHEVTVLTAMPNYPTGKIFPGYGGALRRERVQGVNLIRTYIYPTQEARMLPRLANYVSFVLSAATLGCLFAPRPDYMFVQSPPLFLGPAGWWISRVKRARLVFNVSDLWPESGVQLGVMRAGSKIHRLSSWLEAFAYRKAWLITGQSNSILEDITSRFPGRPTFGLQNGVDAARFGPHLRTVEARKTLLSDAPETTKVVLYAGLHGVAQGLEQAVLAASLLRERSDIRWVFIGDGAEKAALIQKARELDLSNIAFLDPCTAAEIPALLASADILLVPLKSDIPGAVPSKVYEAMASGRPVILAASGEAADIVNEHLAGCVVAPGDHHAIAAAATQLADNPDTAARYGSNGQKAVQTHFDRNAIVDAFLNHLEAELKK